ncbi:MAG: hypothetical protein J7K15_00150, partial [Deltaproteobacteria bacterium]|nr:hypothetical protein [Deltaproteobacteria bacterium]
TVVVIFVLCNYEILAREKSSSIDILHDKSKVVYTLLTLYFGSEIGNWKLGKTQRCKCVT